MKDFAAKIMVRGRIASEIAAKCQYNGIKIVTHNFLRYQLNSTATSGVALESKNFVNSNIEYRNPKQIRISNDQNSKPVLSIRI